MRDATANNVERSPDAVVAPALHGGADTSAVPFAIRSDRLESPLSGRVNSQSFMGNMSTTSITSLGHSGDSGPPPAVAVTRADEDEMSSQEIARVMAQRLKFRARASASGGGLGSSQGALPGLGLKESSTRRRARAAVPRAESIVNFLQASAKKKRASLVPEEHNGGETASAASTPAATLGDDTAAALVSLPVAMTTDASHPLKQPPPHCKRGDDGGVQEETVTASPSPSMSMAESPSAFPGLHHGGHGGGGGAVSAMMFNSVDAFNSPAAFTIRSCSEASASPVDAASHGRDHSGIVYHGEGSPQEEDQPVAKVAAVAE